ncbi:MAG: alpha-galactosidase [Leptospirales bacterium]|nr:alpha-galactosidase [Leptospirales bacterium]
MGYFDRFTARIYYRAKPEGSIYSEKFEERGIVRDSEKGTFQWKPGEKDSTLKGTLKLKGATPVYLERFELVLSARERKVPSVSLHDDISPDSSLRLFQHGYHSWSWTGSRQPHEVDDFSIFKWKHDIDENPETPFLQGMLPLPLNLLPRRGAFHSEFLVMLETNTRTLKRKNGKCIAFSSVGPGDQFVKFRIQLGSHSGKLEELAIIWDGAGILLPGHAIISLTGVKHFENTGERPRTRVRVKRKQNDPAEFLETIANDVAQTFDPPKPGRAITGWCSWYHYYNKISEGILLRNLRLIRERNIKIDFFQIDDGWQKNIGDWLKTAPSFPSGMKFLADATRENGLTPGLWLAPFVARPDSDAFRENQDFLLRDSEGDPVFGLFNPLWGGNTFTFDVTHPRFKAWLENVIHTIVHVWGIPYLKLDFLYAGAYRGQYHDPRLAPATRLRQTYELIRKVAGKKAFLLGCGSPILPSIGPFNAMRIGKDVNSMWKNDLLGTILRDRNYPNAEGCLQNAITRSFMHRKFFLNDPDCILVRDNATKLNLDQVKLMASVMSLTGGMILLSDDLETLSNERLAIFNTALTIHKKCADHTALPLGLMEDHFPRGLYNPAGYLSLHNPTGNAERVQVRLPEGLGRSITRARNVWDGRRIPWTVVQDTVELSLAPYECVLTET